MGKKTQETKVTGPWKPLQQPLKGIIGTAGGMSGDPFNAENSPHIQQAYEQIAGRAMDPNSGISHAVNTFSDTASGKYLDPESNPWLRKTFEAASGDVSRAVNSEFSKAGRYSSGAHQDTLQDGLNQLATSIYAPAYAQERGLQMNAAQMMPYMGIADLQQQLTAGQGLTSLDQQEIDDPWMALQRYLGVLQGVGGMPMGQKTTQSGGTLGMIGAGLAGGARMASNFGAGG